MSSYPHLAYTQPHFAHILATLATLCHTAKKMQPIVWNFGFMPTLSRTFGTLWSHWAHLWHRHFGHTGHTFGIDVLRQGLRDLQLHVCLEDAETWLLVLWATAFTELLCLVSSAWVAE